MMAPLVRMYDGHSTTGYKCILLKNEIKKFSWTLSVIVRAVQALGGSVTYEEIAV